LPPLWCLQANLNSPPQSSVIHLPVSVFMRTHSSEVELTGGCVSFQLA